MNEQLDPGIVDALRAAYAGRTAEDVEADIAASTAAAEVRDPRMLAAYVAQIANEA